MFILIGVIIFIISFFIALASLIGEQKKTQRQQKEVDSETFSETLKKREDDNVEEVKKSGDVKEEARKKLAEALRREEELSKRSEEDKMVELTEKIASEKDAEEALLREKKNERQPFPWEEDFDFGDSGLDFPPAVNPLPKQTLSPQNRTNNPSPAFFDELDDQEDDIAHNTDSAGDVGLGGDSKSGVISISELAKARQEAKKNKS